MEANLTGLRFSNVKEVLESYCDDLNILTDQLQDFTKLSNIVTDFEKLSGAILSRDKKCKVLGLGKWSQKEHWPIPWLRPVKSVKVFGIIVSNRYSQIITENWKFRLEKFSNTLFSWSNRLLSTIQQRVEVLRTFALSRIYYVASVLPIRRNTVRKLESLMGKFIWKGSILRVAIEELKNDPL